MIRQQREFPIGYSNGNSQSAIGMMTPSDKKMIRLWYWSGALLVFLILIIGGITRLTQSGLSMVEWRPLMGIIPPVTDAQWGEVFDRYREFPEYQQRNRGMNLSEFQFIFFWEYLHRMAGRLLGLVFLIPFGYFLIRKSFNSREVRRAVVLLGLGLAQGGMGWYMVMSGLVDVSYVSPYRLAAHLLLAFLIFGCCVWFALDLHSSRGVKKRFGRPSFNLRGWLQLFLAILVLQIAWGAFVAGMNAGLIYNTFPKMNEFWIPSDGWVMEPFITNLIAHPGGVQWMHRLLGTLTGVIALVIWARLQYSDAGKPLKVLGLILLSVVGLQYLTGVYTLLYHVPLLAAVVHQALAMILFGTAVGFYHLLKSYG